MFLFRQAVREERGVVAPVTALTLAALLGFVGLVTDAGLWMMQRRDLQAATDAAALGSARYAALGQTSVRTRAEAILLSNGVAASDLLTVQTGYYCPSENTSVDQFQSVRCASDPATAPINSVRLTTKARGTIIFSRLFTASSVADRPISVTSTAALINEAGLRAGTGVAALNGGVVNAVLSALTGGSVNLTAVQYQGLLNSNVNALPLLDALALKLGVKTGTYDQLLDTDVHVGTVLDAAIEVLGQHGEVADASAAIAGLQAIRAQIAGNGTIRLGKLFDLGVWQNLPVGQSGSSSAALAAGLNVYQLATTSLQVANGSNALALGQKIDLGAIAKINLGTTVIEPPVEPVFGFGPAGTRIHTAQVRTLLQLELLASALSFDIYLEAAGGDAVITQISCPAAPSTVGDQDSTVTVRGNTRVAALYLGKVSPSTPLTNFSSPVTVTKAPLVLGLANVRSQVNLGAGVGDMIFHQPVGTPDLTVQPTLTTGIIGRPTTDEETSSPPRAARVTSSNLLTSLTGSLASNLEVEVCLPLLGCSVGGLLSGTVKLVFQTLTAALGLADPIINELLRALGVQVGYMDTFVTGVRCGVPVLVE